MSDDSSMPSDAATVRLRVDLAYDGSTFHGFAENRDVRTVGGDVRRALQAVLGVPVELTCAGRTDGVNALVGPSVALSRVSVVDDDFDARFSAKDRTYHYTVLNAEVPDPFLVGRAWWVDAPLDMERMSEACTHLIGTHDFSCFCRRPKAPRTLGPEADEPRAPVSLVRQILSAEWSPASDRPELLTFTICATAFCHQMVRSITGMLVDVGRGRRQPHDVAAAVASKDRAKAGQLAPPHGLVLWGVRY